MRRTLSANETIIFLLVWLSLGFFYHGGGHNQAARFDSIRSFLESGTFAIDRYAANSNDTILYDGHVYSNKAPGTMFFGLLPFFVGKTLFGVLGLSENLKYHFACYFTTVFSVSIFSAIAAILVHRILFTITDNAIAALTLTLTVFLGTICFPFGTLFISHQLAASLLLICFYFIFRWKESSDSDRKSKWIIIGGVAGGLAVVSEYPAAIGLFFISIYAIHTLLKRNLMTVFYYGTSVLAGAIPLFIYNYYTFHNFFYVPYEAYAQTGSSFAAFRQGFLGIRNPLTNPEFLHILAQITFFPFRGLFWTSPVLLLSIPGYVIGFSETRKTGRFLPEVTLSAAIFICYLVFNASYGNDPTYWGGAYSFGPRHLIPSLPFLALPLWWSYKHPSLKPIFVVLASVSVLLCLMATAVEPRLAYDYKNPIVQFLLPRYLKGRFALSTWGIFSNELIRGNSVSFNWSKLAGVPGPYQLLPLGLAWSIALYIVAKRNSVLRPQYFSVVIAVACLAPVFHQWISPDSIPQNAGLTGTYYAGKSFSNPPTYVRNDPNVFFDWHRFSPLAHPFAVEWTGDLLIPQTGKYDFMIISDGISSIHIDELLVLSKFTEEFEGVPPEVGAGIYLSKGAHSIRIRYQNASKTPQMKLYWHTPLEALEPLPVENLNRRTATAQSLNTSTP